jgi:Mannose-6-phosphate isomerase
MKNQTKWTVAVFLVLCFLVSVTAASVSPDQKKGLSINLEKATLKNDNFRNVLYTGQYNQLVLMSLKPCEDIGMEVHEDTDQFFYFMDGKGTCIVNGNEYEVRDGYAVFVPAGAHHNVINTQKNHNLKFFTTYSPPEHQDGIVRKTKAEANDPKNKESFDGMTTE